MLRCAVLDDYQNVALTMADWSVLDGRVEVTVFGEAAGPDALAGFDIIVAMRERTPFPAATLARLPRLRLLVTTGMHNAAIDLGAAAEHGVTVCGTRGLAAPTAELTWALILGLARNLRTETTALRDGGPWQSTVGADLDGRTLGLLGFGRLGVRVGRVATAFGMDVQAWSANLTADRTAPEGVRLASSLEDLLSSSDIVSIHLVLGDRTRGLLDAAALARMRPWAYLVNTSRGPIVAEDALIEALREGRIAGAALDVYDTEPLPAAHPFRTLPNVLATPHLGYVTENNYRTFFTGVVEDIAAYLDDAPIRRLTPD